MKVEIVGVVLAVERDPALMARADNDPLFDERDAMAERFVALGFDVQAISFHIDGMARIEVLS